MPRFVDRGMLPNRFPDGGEAPEYNTADATLWMFQALEDYLASQARSGTARAICFRRLASIIHAHVRWHALRNSRR